MALAHQPADLLAPLRRRLLMGLLDPGLVAVLIVWSLSLTAAVIGMALALPAGLYVLLDNVQDATRGWDGSNEVSLFLDLDIDDDGAAMVAGRLREWPEVDGARIISRARALEEFRDLSGFADVMDAFADDNPLPAVIVVTPALNAGDGAAMEKLLGRIESLPEVDFAQFDLAWLKRLYAILAIVERGVVVVAALLAACTRRRSLPHNKSVLILQRSR